MTDITHVRERIGVAISLINRNRAKDGARVLWEVCDEIDASVAATDAAAAEQVAEARATLDALESTGIQASADTPTIEPSQAAGAPADAATTPDEAGTEGAATGEEGKPAPKRTRQKAKPEGDATA